MTSFYSRWLLTYVQRACSGNESQEGKNHAFQTENNFDRLLKILAFWMASYKQSHNPKFLDFNKWKN